MSWDMALRLESAIAIDIFALIAFASRYAKLGSALLISFDLFVFVLLKEGP